MQGDIQSTDNNLGNNWSFKSENYTRNMTYNGSETIVAYEPYELPKEFMITFICLYGIMIFGSVGGNIIVCYTIFTVQRLRTVTNFFLASLSVSDILMTIACIPFTVTSNIIFHYWPFGAWMCPLVQYIQIVTVLQRAFTMVAVACDRHFVISRPLKKRMTKPKARVLILIFWLVALLTALPTAIHSKIMYLPREPGSNGLCMEIWHSHKFRYIYSVVLMLLQYFLPLMIMMCTYLHIGYMIWIKQAPGEADSNRDMRIASSKRKTLKMLVAVVITYALTWLPLHALTIMGDINPNLYNHMHTHIMWLTFHFVAFSNSGTNPIIYCYMNKTFRVGFNLFFSKIFCINKQTPHGRRFTMSVPSTPSSRSFTGYIQYNSRVAKKQRKANGPCMYSTELNNL